MPIWVPKAATFSSRPFFFAALGPLLRAAPVKRDRESYGTLRA